MRMHAVGRRPVIGLVTLFLAGAGAGLAWGNLLRPEFLLLAAAIALVAAVVPRGWPFLYVALFLAGATMSCLEVNRLEQGQRLLQQFAEVHDGRVCVEIRIDRDVTVFRHEGSRESRRFRGRVLQLNGHVLTAADPRPLVQVYHYGRVARPLHAGMHVRCEGVVRGGQDWRDPSRLVVLGPLKSQRFPQGRLPFVAAGAGIRQRAARRLALGIEDAPVIAGLLRALILGYREDLHTDLNELFIRTGALHLFALSGLHIGMIVLILMYVLRSLRLSQMYWILVIAPVLAGYIFITGAKASAVRAGVMAVCYFSALFVRRKPDAPSALFLAALLIVAYDPTQLCQVGFVFSFLVVLGLLIYVGPLTTWLERHVQPEPWGPAGPGRAVPLRRLILSGCFSLVAVAVSAWLFSAPLTWYYFGRIVPVGLLANVLVVPVAFLAVLSSCLSFAAGSVHDLGAEIFNHAALVWGWLLVQTAHAVDRIPGGMFIVARPHWLLPTVGYGLLAALGLYLPRSHAKRIDT